MIMTTKISIPNGLLSTNEQSKKSYEHQSINPKDKINLNEAICIIMGVSIGANA